MIQCLILILILSTILIWYQSVGFVQSVSFTRPSTNLIESDQQLCSSNKNSVDYDLHYHSTISLCVCHRMCPTHSPSLVPRFPSSSSSITSPPEALPHGCNYYRNHLRFEIPTVLTYFVSSHTHTHTHICSYHQPSISHTALSKQNLPSRAGGQSAPHRLT